MVYKYTDLVQNYTFECMEDFLLDVEDLFKQKIDMEKTHDYGCLMVIAPRTFIETLFYYFILNPHCAPEIQTRFSMFKEYSLNEIVGLLNNEAIETLAFTIASDRVCFIENLDKLPNIFEKDCGENFYYIHKDSTAKWLNRADGKRVLCFDFDT